MVSAAVVVSAAPVLAGPSFRRRYQPGECERRIVEGFGLELAANVYFGAEAVGKREIAVRR